MGTIGAALRCFKAGCLATHVNTPHCVLSYLPRCAPSYLLGSMVTNVLLSLLLILPFRIHASPFQLAAPILLGTSTNNVTSLSTVNSVSLQVSPGNCFDPKPGRLPTNYRDCERALLQLNPDGIVAQLFFGRVPYTQFRLPRSFRAGTCVYYLRYAFQ